MDIIGRTIVGIKEIDVDSGWHEKTIGIFLDDGSVIYALSDEEGNDTGVLILKTDGKGEFYIED